MLRELRYNERKGVHEPAQGGHQVAHDIGKSEKFMNYFQFNINDYAQATAHLNFIEDAALMRLLRKYYAEERPLPADIQSVQRLIGARTREEKSATKSVLEEFFILGDEGWINSRAEKIITEYHGKSSKAAASAHVRWDKTHTERNANAMRTQCESDANAMLTSKPLTSKPVNQEEKIKTTRVTTHVCPVGVGLDTWAEFLLARKAKKATVSDKVVDAIRKEADKAGWPLEKALTEIIARGWTGFKAEWVADKQSGKKTATEVAAWTMFNYGKEDHGTEIDITPAAHFLGR
jgi:uncharacterized protein YdaU (DUF1376 family)